MKDINIEEDYFCKEKSSDERVESEFPGPSHQFFEVIKNDREEMKRFNRMYGRMLED